MSSSKPRGKPPVKSPEQIRHYFLRKSRVNSSEVVQVENTVHTVTVTDQSTTHVTTDAMAGNDIVLKAIADLDKKLSAKLDDLDKSFSKRIEDLEESARFSDETIKELTEKVEKQSKQIKALDSKYTAADVATKECRDRVTHLERRSRAYSIRIKQKKKFEDTKDYIPVAAKIITDNDLACGKSQEDVEKLMEIAHPLGEHKKQLIVRFYSRPERDRVIQLAKKNLNSKNEGAVRIVEDMVKEDYDKKLKAWPIMKKEYAAGKKVRFTGGRLFVNKKEVEIPDE